MISSHNSRHIILDLLYASEKNQSSIKRLICAGELLGLTENAIRVAISRLVQDDYIYPVSRGVYALTYKKYRQSLFDIDQQSMNANKDEWQNSFILVSTYKQDQTERHTYDQRRKILNRLGFQAFEPFLYIRPYNLNISIQQLKIHLIQSGLAEDTPLFSVKYTDQLESIQQLWPITELNQAYLDTADKIQNWLNTHAKLSIADAAYNGFFLGKEAFELCYQDPILPAAWINAVARTNFIQHLKLLDVQAKNVWQTYFQSQNL